MTIFAAAKSENSPFCELVITLILDAPREVVFNAWTRPGHLIHWWGPKDFTAPSADIELRPGGTYRICMRSPAGAEFWVHGVYREIVAPERVCFTWYDVEDAKGKPKHETLITVTFTEHRGKTKVTLHQGDFDSRMGRDAHEQCWMESFTRLKAFVAARCDRRIANDTLI